MEKRAQNENSARQTQSSAEQHFETTPALQSFSPPAMQLKAQGNPEKSEPDQGKAEIQLKGKKFASGTDDNPSENPSTDAPFQLKENTNNTGLPDNLKSGVESLSGFSLDDVNVHYNSDKPAQLNAHAYAQGTDIHVASGQEKHLPHEAWHVVQQKQGRVQPTTQLKAFKINEDTKLEKEADLMGAKAMQMKAEVTGNKKNVLQGRVLQKNAIQLSIKEEIIKFGNKLGVPKTIGGIASHFGISNTEAHQILSSGKSDEDKLKDLNEPGNKIKAQNMEHDDEMRTGGSGGHAIARHGPGISNAALEKRLYSGMAPDNALSPAPGSSSKFKTYTAMIETRQAAAASLNSEIVNTQSKILKWKNAAIGGGKLKDIDDSMKAREIKKQSASDTADANHTKLMADYAANKSLGAQIPNSINNKTSKKAELDAAKEKSRISGEELVTPGKNLMRLWPGTSKFSLDIKEGANDGTLEDNVKLIENYTIVVRHPEAIGEGFKSDDAINLTDVVKQAATNPGADDATDLIPKSIPDIKTALTALSVGGDVDEFATYLSDAGNLKTARKKGSKGGKIYKSTQVAGDLFNTTTNLKVEGDKKLFTSNLGAKSDKPNKLDTANWPAIQHFPAAEDAELGVK